MEAGHIELEADLIEAIARRVAQLLGGEAAGWSLIDAAAVADRLGVDREWVYGHADDLGAIRLGGPHGRLRFDMNVVRERLGGEEPTRWGRRRRAARIPGGGRVKSKDAQRRASVLPPARRLTPSKGKEPR